MKRANSIEDKMKISTKFTGQKIRLKFKSIFDQPDTVYNDIHSKLNMTSPKMRA